MIATELQGRAQVRGFGTYNAVAAVAGSLGALAAGLTDVLHDALERRAHAAHWFLALVPGALLGLAIALRLTPGVEGDAATAGRAGPARRSRPRSSAWPSSSPSTPSAAGSRCRRSSPTGWAPGSAPRTEQVGVLFFVLGLLQTALVPGRAEAGRAVRAAAHDGVHPPAVEPAARRRRVRAHLRRRGGAADGPDRAVADGRPDPPGLRHGARRPGRAHRRPPPTRTPCATSPARSVRRWPRPAQQIALGLPFVIGGGIKTVYDLTLWRWFRTVPLPDDE